MIYKSTLLLISMLTCILLCMIIFIGISAPNIKNNPAEITKMTAQNTGEYPVIIHWQLNNGESGVLLVPGNGGVIYKIPQE